MRWGRAALCWRSVVLLAALLLAGVQVGAQTFNLETQREAVTSLKGLWRFHPGDDPAWAKPEFDDSKWALIRSGASWTKQGYPGLSGYAWYRFTLQLPAGNKPQAMMLPIIYTGYQVFADGALIGSRGSTAPTLAPVFAADYAMFSLPESRARRAGQAVQIAIRVWTYKPIADWIGGGTLYGFGEAGDTDQIASELQETHNVLVLSNVGQYAYFVLAAAVGVTLLALFLLRRSEREYLWFAIWLLVGAADAALTIRGWADMRFLVFRLLDEIAVATRAVSAVLFFTILLQLRRSPLWWLICGAAAASPITVAFYYLQLLPIGVTYAIQLGLLIPAYLWIVYELGLQAYRGAVAARLMVVPAALFYGYSVDFAFAYMSSALRLRHGLPYPNPLMRFPYRLEQGDLALYLFILSILIFLVWRFSVSRRQEERFSVEVAAARGVQELLVPEYGLETPGFVVESVYLPASEVGGDFFQILPMDGEGLMLVIGDVAGKGIPAAMLVALAVGVIRTAADDGPGEMLAVLNDRLVGRCGGGFSTALAAQITCDGVVTIANAGHLSPYLDGREVELPGALPLGIVSGARYETTEFRLDAGSRLTFYSDGIVEAQTAKGQLFGFERGREMSTRPAAEIAEAAKVFGQTDDITVVAIGRV